ncbi:hypothetical protein DPMN_000492 [Dreissena polymorpha]|uniref:Protein kinase domain-containing protein n=2 Tax=Dreissena polymorpha TaxID=45954 RepID=A0A9D4RPZ3_DREPO|nr:hypothetical protein DPMN_000492 [Dreissena polymorpha]
MQHASGTWEWVKRHIETAFDNRLNDLLDEWDRETQQISDVEKKLFRQAKLHLSDLESEMTEIEKECHTENLPAALRDSGVFLNNLCRSIEDFEEDLLFDHKVPHKLLSQLSKKITRQIRKKREDLKLKEYENSPSKVAQKQAEKLLDKMLKDKDPRLESFVREFLQRPFNYISRLESKIPSLIDSNKELQGRFEKEVVDEGKERQHYVEMMTRIEKLRTDLVRYGELSVFCNDFENEDIEIVQHFHESKGRNMKRKQSMADLMQANQLSDDTCSTIVPHGQWHIVHIGRIRRGSETEYVVVKLYKVKIDNMQTELAKLRCLLHNDVCLAEFLGVHHQPDFMTPALIFSGKLQSAHNYTRTHPDVNKPKLLEEVLTGLQYIHSKGLVHMELSKYSLTVNASGNVQMTGQCLPRTMTADPYNNVSSNVYLAPEVLRGSIYVAHADMYAFAILALEIMDPKKSDDDRIVTLTRQGSKALQAEIMQLELDSRVNEKLTACLNAMEERPSAQIVAATLKFKDRKLSTLAPRNIFARLTLKK